jgi:hypothetical protein
VADAVRVVPARAVEFARFYGLEFSARANMPDIVNAVCATAAHTGIELVLVDFTDRR